MSAGALSIVLQSVGSSAYSGSCTARRRSSGVGGGNGGWVGAAVGMREVQREDCGVRQGSVVSVDEGGFENMVVRAACS